MKKILTIINTVFFVFTIAPIVNSQTIDQTHTGTNNWYTCLSTTQILGQSFTAEISGALTKISIDFALSCSDATEYPITIEIVQGSFHANPLASESIVVNLPYDRNMLEVNFSNPANVTAGDEYMIRLTPDYVTCEDDPFMGPMEACGLWYTSNGDGYPLGVPLIISGGTANSDGNNDRYFTTTVTEASPGIILNGAVSAESNQIKNVADPTDTQDVATKSYVDSNVNSFSGSYDNLTNKPIIYTQSEVDDLMSSLLSDLDSLGSIIESMKAFVNYSEIDYNSSSTPTADGKFIYAMGPNGYSMGNESGYYSFDPVSKTFSQTNLDPYVQDSYYKWTKPAVNGDGKVFEFSSLTEIRNATDDISYSLPGGYKAYGYYDYVNGFDSNVSSALFLVRTDSMNENGVHIAYFDDQNTVQILDPGFEFNGGMENMSHQYEEGYFFMTKYGVNNPYEYYVINFNAQTPQAVKINFPSTDNNSRPYSKTYAGNGKFYVSYQKNGSDYYSKTILLLDTTSGGTSEIFTTSSGAAHLTMASNKKLYYHNNYGNNNDNNIHVYDPITNIHSLIAPPEGGTNVTLFATYGKTVEMNGKLILRYFFSGYEVQNARHRLYELDIQTETLNEINPNGVLDNYQYNDFYGPYSDDRVYNQPFNPMFIYDGKLYVIFRGTSDYEKHYIMVYDGVSAELIDPEQAGGLKSFVEMMFM